MRSATPSSSLEHTARVASGVTSRGAIPVPPVVATNCTSPAKRRIACSISACSSGTTPEERTKKPLLSRTRVTAGPDKSSRPPRAQESLIVRTAAVGGLAVEEDIFFLTRCSAFIALGLIKQTQALHQQALRIQSRSLL